MQVPQFSHVRKQMSPPAFAITATFLPLASSPPVTTLATPACACVCLAALSLPPVCRAPGPVAAAAAVAVAVAAEVAAGGEGATGGVRMGGSDSGVVRPVGMAARVQAGGA